MTVLENAQLNYKLVCDGKLNAPFISKRSISSSQLRTAHTNYKRKDAHAWNIFEE